MVSGINPSELHAAVEKGSVRVIQLHVLQNTVQE
jgi:hypothetical protein